jgi:hypothetical protein
VIFLLTSLAVFGVVGISLRWPIYWALPLSLLAGDIAITRALAAALCYWRGPR